MRGHSFAIGVIIAGLSLVVHAQVGGQRQFSIEDLGPDPFVTPLDTLSKEADSVPAVIIGDVVSAGKLKFEEVAVPHSTKLSIQGYATYEVHIKDVVFNRTQQNGSAPVLERGSTITMLQAVGQEGAQKYTEGHTPVAAGDECLLFLLLRPHGWDHGVAGNL
jgi:hypothetical protein